MNREELARQLCFWHARDTEGAEHTKGCVLEIPDRRRIRDGHRNCATGISGHGIPRLSVALTNVPGDGLLK